MDVSADGADPALVEGSPIVFTSRSWTHIGCNQAMKNYYQYIGMPALVSSSLLILRIKKKIRLSFSGFFLDTR